MGYLRMDMGKLLDAMKSESLDRVRSAGGRAAVYARSHPWKAAGLAAVTAVALGAILKAGGSKRA